MKRHAILALAVVAAALLLAGGVALAEDITCTDGRCDGTEGADRIIGSAGDDAISGLAGSDTINGDTALRGGLIGDDQIRGGRGADVITDDTSLGVGGALLQDNDEIFGGRGDDTIDVRENTGGADVVDCGAGKDTVFLDPVDKATNCERINPIRGPEPVPA